MRTSRGKAELAAGALVRIRDYPRAMRTCLNRDRGDGILYGAGGCVLPSGVLELPAVVCSVGAHRALIEWPEHDVSLWIDQDNLTPLTLL